MKEGVNQIDLVYKYQKQMGYLESIYVYRGDSYEDGTGFNVEIVLSDYPFYECDPKLVLKCYAVRRLSLSKIDNLCKALFEIENVYNYQMEDIHYTVKEIENNIISFVCKDIEVEVRNTQFNENNISK